MINLRTLAKQSLYKSHLIVKYLERWVPATYLGFLSANDINRGILIVAIHECCLSIYFRQFTWAFFNSRKKAVKD